MRVLKKSDVLNIRYTKESISEFPLMWEKIVKHLNNPISESQILDDTLFMNDDIIKITGECGDQLFGSDALHKNLDKKDNLINQPPIRITSGLDWETNNFWKINSSIISVSPSYTFKQFKTPVTITPTELINDC